MLRKLSLTALAVALLVAALPASEEPIDHEMNARIIHEETTNSQVMRTLHYLTDVYGPRLTGSPAYKAAADWALKQMADWGLQNGHLEPWDFGHPGWTNERQSVFVTAPVRDTLVAEVLAWTPSTKGTVKAAIVRLEPPEGPLGPPAPAGPFGGGGRRPLGPTADELQTYLSSIRGQVAGKIVFVRPPADVPVNFNPPAMRRDYDQLLQQYDPNRPPAPPRMPPARPEQEGPKRLSAREVDQAIDTFLVAAGAAVRVNDAGMLHGEIRAFNNRTYDTSKAVPTVILRAEDYGRLWRIAEDGTPVEMEVTVVNHEYPEGKTTWNVIAEIPGTDKADEVVMLGGHLDSWHAATGATDNATGCAVMMEAARILKTLGVEPRRTIRVALWSAEEEGLLGSQEYVKEHFGTFESPKPDYAKLDAYFNVDSGTGRIRGAGIFGPPEAAAVLRQILGPMADFGVVGASATDSRRTGGTDSTSFNAAGLPGVGLSQDPIEYFTTTWHTNLDTYERAVPEDLRKAAIVVASAVYHVAMRDEMLPRFPAGQMPKPAGR